MSDRRQTLSGTDVSRLLVFAAPLLWAVLVLLHPMPGADSPYQDLKDEVDLWLVVHVGQLVLTPFLFLAVWRLLEGLSSTAAIVSRCALVVWTVFFSAYDSIQGVATGVLTSHANDLAGGEQTAVAGAIEYLVSDDRLAGNVSAIQIVASVSWLVVAIAAAVALHKASAGRVIVVATVLATVFAAHEAPAAIGLVALSVAGVLRELQRRKDPDVPPATSVVGTKR